MGFWANTKNFKKSNNNGTNYLNVSGVPGAYANREIFIYPIEKALDKSGKAITEEVVKVAIKCFKKIGDHKQLKADLAKPNKWWISSLHGKNKDVEDNHYYAGAAYLVWWLSAHKGKVLENDFNF